MHHFTKLASDGQSQLCLRIRSFINKDNFKKGYTILQLCIGYSILTRLTIKAWCCILFVAVNECSHLLVSPDFRRKENWKRFDYFYKRRANLWHIWVHASKSKKNVAIANLQILNWDQGQVERFVQVVLEYFILNLSSYIEFNAGAVRPMFLSLIDENFYACFQPLSKQKIQTVNTLPFMHRCDTLTYFYGFPYFLAKCWKVCRVQFFYT